MTGTLTCTTTATNASPVGDVPDQRTAAGSRTTASTSSTTTPSSNYTVTKAPLTVTADPKSRLFGQANPPLTATLSGFVLGQVARHLGRHGPGGLHDDGDAVQPGRRLPDHVHAGDAGLGELQLRPVRRRHAHGHVLAAVHHRRPLDADHGERGSGDLHRSGRRDQRADHGRIPAARSTSRAATIAGSIRSTGATAFRMCGAQMSGPAQGQRHDRPRADRRRRGHRAVRRQQPHRRRLDHRQQRRRRVQLEQRHRLARDHGQHGQRPAAGHRRGARGRQHGRRPEARSSTSEAERGRGRSRPSPRGYAPPCRRA